MSGHDKVQYTLKKSEILRGKKIIGELFTNGSSFFLYPFKIVYLVRTEPGASHEVLFSVSKKYFKKSVDRNAIKRRLREAYRLNKGILNDKPNGGISYSLAFIYISKMKMPFHEIEHKLKEALLRLLKIKLEKS